MILKVQDADADLWIFVDGIEQCQVGKAYLRRDVRGDDSFVGLYRTEEQRKLPEGAEDSDTLFIEISYIPNDWTRMIRDGNEQCIEIKVADLKMRGGRHQTIAFGSSGFLLNDEGKTIERL